MCRAFRVRSEGGLRLLQSGGFASQEVHVGRREANWAGHHLPILERVARHCRQDFDGLSACWKQEAIKANRPRWTGPMTTWGRHEGGQSDVKGQVHVVRIGEPKRRSRFEAEAKLRGGGGTFGSSLIRQCRFNNCFSAAAIHNSPTDDGVAVMQRPAVKLPAGREARAVPRGPRGPPGSSFPVQLPRAVLSRRWRGSASTGQRLPS